MREDKDVSLIRHFITRTELEIDIYSKEIERLEEKIHKLNRQQNGLLKELHEKTGGR